MDPRSANPRISINDRGLVLVKTSAGEWVIQGAADGSAHVASDRLMWLLPLLERGPADVVAALYPGGSQTDPLLQDLLRFALTAWGSYWPACALTWLESGWPSDGLVGVLADMQNVVRLPRHLRHRARRLWRAGREP
jgi:hypothetical protein